MIVISDATSHQTSISKMLNVAASEVPKATTIAELMSVIMPGLFRKFTPGSADKDQSAIDEDDCSEDRGNKLRAGKGRSGVTEPVLNVG